MAKEKYDQSPIVREHARKQNAVCWEYFAQPKAP